MAAQPAKEARSLWDLNFLASNPPQYPEKPHEERQPPLELYIVRVPGTRDIVLSTHKPSAKNVTNQDVENSLYYIHLELPGNELAASSPFSSHARRRPSNGGAPVMPIPRKPVPNSARPITPDSASGSNVNLAAPALENRQHDASMTSQDAYRPALSSSLAHESYTPASDLNQVDHQPQRASLSVQPPPSRKPVGPRAMTPSSLAVPGSAPTSPTTVGRLRSQSATSGARDWRDTHHLVPSSRSPSPRKRSAASVPAGEPFALQLIRRDPMTGYQWNVGRITSRQLEHSTQEETQQTGISEGDNPPPPDSVSTSSPPINIHIENSGYAKYRDMPRRHSLQSAGLAAQAADDNTLVHGGGVFARKLQMGYTKSLMSNLKDKFQRFEEQMNKKGTGHGRSGSDSSQEAPKEHTTPTVGQPGPGMKPRGYTFTTPWDDRCYFRTGSGGRSVLCYQAPYDNGSQFASYNQLLEEQGINLPRLSATALSELRFNLPSTELLVNTNQDETNGESKLKGHFAKFLRTAGHHDGDGDDAHDDSVASPFDMNIGGERAGGGNRGNRAKLGKLVIYNEGLKMLDLLVSANVGVWWGAWERSF